MADLDLELLVSAAALLVRDFALQALGFIFEPWGEGLGGIEVCLAFAEDVG